MSLPEDATFGDIAFMKMKLAWLADSHFDWLFEVSLLTQITMESFEEDRYKIVRRINKLITYTKENQTALCFFKLDPSQLKLIGSSDASFAGNRDFTSQVEYFIFGSDKSGVVVPMLYKSFKARRVTSSVIGADLISFSDMFDA